MSASRPEPLQARQLALAFPLTERFSFDNFIAGRNGELVRRLQRLDAEAGFRGVYLHGAAGVGRTHLLQAVCHRHGSRGGIYLPLRDPSVTPELLEGLDTLYLVALDDVDAWFGDAGAEAALLALYQGLLAGGGRLLVSASRAPDPATLRYPDLASRLRGLPTYRVHELADRDKARVIDRLARARGLELGDAVLDFWLARSPRDLAALVAQLERLDEAAMAEQRRVTVPLVKKVLGL